MICPVTWGVTTSGGSSSRSGSSWSSTSGSNIADQAADVNTGKSLQNDSSESLHSYVQGFLLSDADLHKLRHNIVFFLCWATQVCADNTEQTMEQI